jgi:hypothetical protein
MSDRADQTTVEMDVSKPGSHSLLRLARNSNGGGQ